ncbi:hypothetical protein OGAPHI_000206 [Ogataea philodendri]|uniref:Uncharacterized protein n=1 Tax=Ogataea philodendri TaxID=1378263 RepID=A0A9P8PFU4_9ASCO|nr:uncharacterized protein OGAPHI_000206 [Ogataea philodendri]KAH3671503.1 hypothetical protein OGAPHI_000206 [Ogataea philodendri]
MKETSTPSSKQAGAEAGHLQPNGSSHSVSDILTPQELSSDDSWSIVTGSDSQSVTYNEVVSSDDADSEPDTREARASVSTLKNDTAGSQFSVPRLGSHDVSSDSACSARDTLINYYNIAKAKRPENLKSWHYFAVLGLALTVLVGGSVFGSREVDCPAITQALSADLKECLVTNANSDVGCVKHYLDVREQYQNDCTFDDTHLLWEFSKIKFQRHILGEKQIADIQAKLLSVNEHGRRLGEYGEVGLAWFRRFGNTLAEKAKAQVKELKQDKRLEKQLIVLRNWSSNARVTVGEWASGFIEEYKAANERSGKQLAEFFDSLKQKYTQLSNSAKLKVKNVDYDKIWEHGLDRFKGIQDVATEQYFKTLVKATKASHYIRAQAIKEYKQLDEASRPRVAYLRKQVLIAQEQAVDFVSESYKELGRLVEKQDLLFKKPVVLATRGAREFDRYLRDKVLGWYNDFRIPWV